MGGCLAVMVAVLAGCGLSLPGAEPAEDSGVDPGTRACVEVEAGIDAFNEGDFEETVRRFEAALPHAEEHAAEQESERADLLLEAVRWYAALPPDEYADASRDSEKFARHQAVALAQCVVGEPGDEPSDETPDETPDEDESDSVLV